MISYILPRKSLHIRYFKWQAFGYWKIAKSFTHWLFRYDLDMSLDSYGGLPAPCYPIWEFLDNFGFITLIFFKLDHGQFLNSTDTVNDTSFVNAFV